MYTIRSGHLPFHDLAPPERVRNLIRNEFPSTAADSLLGDITKRCWAGYYASLHVLEQDLLARLTHHSSDEETGDVKNLEEMQELLLHECMAFLASKYAGPDGGMLRQG